jgi:hypothetical protein
MEINNLPSTSSHIANPCDPPQNEEVKIVGMQINLFRNLDIKKKVINTTKGQPLVFGDRELQCIFSKGISSKRHKQIQCGFSQTKDNK